MQKLSCLKYFILVLFLKFQLKAQTLPYSEKLVSLKAINLSYKEVFDLLSKQTGAVFSYAQTFNDKQKINLIATKKTLRLVLTEILIPAESSYRFNGKYVVIKYTPSAKPQNILAGYVYNLQDSSLVSKASIYLKQTKQSANSNEFGYFKLNYSEKTPTVSVSFAKEAFQDTSIVIYKPSKKEITIYLMPKKQKVDTTLVQTYLKEDTLKSKVIVDTIITSNIAKETPFWKFFKKRNVNLKNITDTLFSNVAVSLVPPISTNQLLAINTVNKFSLNILAGYSKGLNGAEFGGIANITNGDVKYFQAAGITNLVSGNVTGVQLAGIVNANKGNTNGVQAAGIGNFNWGNVSGVQLAGIFNFNRKEVKGCQLAGIINGCAKDVSGAQLAGIANLAENAPFQAAGIVNISWGTIKAAQLAGIVNITKVSEKLQAAGCVNLSEQNNGLQVSGVLNVAKKNNGLQLGIINYADTSAGIPIGVFSFVRKGYHKIELASDELTFTTIGFRTGVEKFHNILFGGINLKNTNLFTVGYGIGSTFTLYKKLLITPELTAQQLIHLDNKNFYNNSIFKFNLGAEFKFNKFFRMCIGPSINLMLNDKTDPKFESTYNTLVNTAFWTSNNTSTKLNAWLGLKVSLKVI